MSKDPQIVDLDALVPPEAIVKLGDKEFSVPQPSVEQVFRLAALSRQLQLIDTDTPKDEITKISAQARDLVDEVVPDLKGVELASMQVLKLIDIIDDMTTPPEVREAREKGISSASPKAKA